MGCKLTPVVEQVSRGVMVKVYGPYWSLLREQVKRQVWTKVTARVSRQVRSGVESGVRLRE